MLEARDTAVITEQTLRARVVTGSMRSTTSRTMPRTSLSPWPSSRGFPNRNVKLSSTRSLRHRTTPRKSLSLCGYSSKHPESQLGGTCHTVVARGQEYPRFWATPDSHFAEGGHLETATHWTSTLRHVGATAEPVANRMQDFDVICGRLSAGSGRRLTKAATKCMEGGRTRLRHAPTVYGGGGHAKLDTCSSKYTPMYCPLDSYSEVPPTSFGSSSPEHVRFPRSGRLTSTRGRPPMSTDANRARGALPEFGQVPCCSAGVVHGVHARVAAGSNSPTMLEELWSGCPQRRRIYW